jgi:signal transduction histidine kinase/ActR/RegA family two-component response regulator
MDNTLPFFNWSLKKALETEPDSFVKARIRIIYTIILFSLLKIFVVLGFAFANAQWLQAVRAIAALVFYVCMVKFLLYKPSRINQLAHIMLILGIGIVWTNVFIYAHKVNLPTLQFVFMITLSSFYTLGSVYGIAYSIAGILPVILFLIFGNHLSALTKVPQQLASPGFEIVIVLNFISMILAHYLFYEAFHVNIKDKEKLNAQLQLSTAEAHKLAESRSNFLSTMSHELRTPLNSVIGITELLRDDKPEARQMEHLNILHTSAVDLLSLINNILDFNKIDSDKLVLETVPFSLTEFTRNICSGLRLKANDKHLDFVLEIDQQLEQTNVISDPTRLSQLMYNLVGNAIKFTEKGTITVQLDCVNKTANSMDVLFSVKDTGIGIHPDRHKAIFELFTQAESHITRKYGGTGLGLAIVKQVLALFNSSLKLESSSGNGSRFFFTIPFTLAPVVEHVKLPAAENADLRYLKILIAEDNDVNRLLMKKQLERLNINAVIVENGQLAYEAYLTDDFDAIFMDLHMPVLDGYEATKKIRALAEPGKAKVYIIAFTASVTEQQQIFDTGFDDFLYKPVNMNDLREKLEKIVLLKSNLGNLSRVSL